MLQEYIECACSAPEHTLQFVVDPDPEGVDFYTTVYLNQPNNFFKRVWIALKYIFGSKTGYGHFDCTLFKPEDIPRMRKLLDFYEENLQKHSQKNSKE